MKRQYNRPNDCFDLMNRLDGAELSLEERSVLWGQYKFADTDGRNSRVSEGRLAQYLNVTDRTVRRHRKTLKQKGWLIECERGWGSPGSEQKAASRFEVVLPANPPEVATKPKRVPNPTGRNQYTKATTGQICPTELPDTVTKNPRELPDRSNHLPTLPSEDLRSSANGVVQKDASVPSGEPDGSSGTCPRCGWEDPWGGVKLQKHMDHDCDQRPKGKSKKENRRPYVDHSGFWSPT